MRTSQAIASSQPPPNASALTAAIVDDRERSELAQQRVRRVEQLAPAGLVHLRERLDVGAGARTAIGFDEAIDERADRRAP